MGDTDGLILKQLLGRLLGDEGLGSTGCRLLDPMARGREHSLHIQHGSLHHLAVGRVAAANRVRHLVGALEATREAFLGATDKALLANPVDFCVKRRLAAGGTVVGTLVTAFAVQIVRPP